MLVCVRAFVHSWSGESVCGFVYWCCTVPPLPYILRLDEEIHLRIAEGGYDLDATGQPRATSTAFIIFHSIGPFPCHLYRSQAYIN